MQIKQHLLAQHVQKKTDLLYVLIGQDAYFLDQSFAVIRAAIHKKYNCDEKVISIQKPDDWYQLNDEANSYSLFSDTHLLNVSFDKKSLDATGKKILTDYLKASHSHCFTIIRAPHVPLKQVQWIAAHETAVLSVAYPLNEDTMKQWIATQLKDKSFQFNPQIPEIIYQYTQGNMLACAQAIEKISLSNEVNTTITLELAREHLTNQWEHNLFEITEACLQGQKNKLIQILRYASQNKTEAPLVLWILTQEIRVLIQLTHLIEAQVDFKTACMQLKIWSQRINLYQFYWKRMQSNAELKKVLSILHHYSRSIDDHIKTNANYPVWNSIENLALSLCLGQLIGDTCSI